MQPNIFISKKNIKGGEGPTDMIPATCGCCRQIGGVHGDNATPPLEPLPVDREGRIQGIGSTLTKNNSFIIFSITLWFIFAIYSQLIGYRMNI